MSTSKYLKIIVKLNRDTNEEKIYWEINRSIPLLSAHERLIDNVYTVKISDKNLRLFKYDYRYYLDEDTYDWVRTCRLEFIDIHGNSEWTFPNDLRNAIEDLYETVRFKTAKVDNFLNDYLSESELSDDIIDDII